MLIPTKHEDLEKNVLVLGADILDLIKKKSFRPYNIEVLFQDLKIRKEIGIEQYYDTLLFLWLIDTIELRNHYVYMRKNVS